MAENDKQDAVSLGDGRYKCPCGYIYDPAKGDPKRDIPDDFSGVGEILLRIVGVQFLFTDRIEVAHGRVVLWDQLGKIRLRFQNVDLQHGTHLQ